MNKFCIRILTKKEFNMADSGAIAIIKLKMDSLISSIELNKSIDDVTDEAIITFKEIPSEDNLFRHFLVVTSIIEKGFSDSEPGKIGIDWCFNGEFDTYLTNEIEGNYLDKLNSIEREDKPAKQFEEKWFLKNLLLYIKNNY